LDPSLTPEALRDMYDTLQNEAEILKIKLESEQQRTTDLKAQLDLEIARSEARPVIRLFYF
jgi:hypothetical protein